jgi:hypothetical protein
MNALDKDNDTTLISVPRTGLEPACPLTGASPSSWCVYQFHHLGKNLFITKREYKEKERTLK